MTEDGESRLPDKSPNEYLTVQTLLHFSTLDLMWVTLQEEK